MVHKVYVSFKTEDLAYKEAIAKSSIDCIDKSLEVPIDSDDEDYVMQCIREEYLSDSTVTIHLIGRYGAEDRGEYEQRYIKRELQASLYDGAGNTKNGILGLVLPSMKDVIYGGSQVCSVCGGSHNIVRINDSTTVREFSYNYYIPHTKCAWSEEERYCVVATWEDFVKSPAEYIDQAFDKRESPIAKKTRVRP